MSVTACLITRNHDRSVEQAVRSVRGLAAEVVVADTGSTDRTVALAEGLGARVVPIGWADTSAGGTRRRCASAGCSTTPRTGQGFALADRRERPAG